MDVPRSLRPDRRSPCCFGQYAVTSLANLADEQRGRPRSIREMPVVRLVPNQYGEAIKRCADHYHPQPKSQATTLLIVALQSTRLMEHNPRSRDLDAG